MSFTLKLGAIVLESPLHFWKVSLLPKWAGGVLPPAL